MFVRIIFSLILSFSSACAVAQATKPLTLADDAPDRHVVVKGDTLWDISGKFLRDPWRWPEVWRLNRNQIRNPHLIYPGQVVALDRSGSSPRLSIGQSGKVEPQIYSEPSAVPIPSIPQQVIDPYLAQPLVMDANGLDQRTQDHRHPGRSRGCRRRRHGLRHGNQPQGAPVAGISPTQTDTGSREPKRFSATRRSFSAMRRWCATANQRPWKS